jgi:hypothetical protein
MMARRILGWMGGDAQVCRVADDLCRIADDT